MLTIAIEITGVSALICNKFSDSAQQKSDSGTSSSSAAADRGTPLQRATDKLYTGVDGKTLIVPGPNLLRCLIDGGRYFKVGKTQLTTKESSVLFACVTIDPAEVPIIHNEPWRVDTRPVVIPATKGRVLMHRPIFDDWKLRFNVELDTSICGARLFRQVVDAAGSRIGLGDFRPARKGPYGRFAVTHWAEEEVQFPLAAE